MADRLVRLKEKSTRRVVGLNVGTSLDGIDAALLEVSGFGLETRFRLLRYETLPLPDGIRRAILGVETLDVRGLARIDVELGEALGRAQAEITALAGLAAGEVDLIGSHGATVWHEPPRHGRELGTSLQIGKAAIIVERSGAVVVSDFRSADIAASGQGAPLMPWLDHLLFQRQPGTIVLNLGGIANLSYVSGEIETLLAFDAGPANLPLNQVVRMLTKGEAEYDDGGRLAATGHVDRVLLDRLGDHPFLSQAPPKSTGREEFGEVFTRTLLERHGHMRLIDILATLTAFVARCVRRSVADFIEPRPLRQVLVSGGGLHNHTLMHHLKREFEAVPVQSFSYHERGFDPDAKEAVLFALLANDRIFERPAGVPAATGALWPALLGQISY